MGIREICIGYGQTEASPIITFTSVDDPIEVRVGHGRAADSRASKSSWSTRRAAREVATGETGELCVRGHCVMAGYYNNPEATASAIDADGWLHTGDLARRRDDGNYRIVGRSKELIIRGGENIYPAEVEEFLHQHPAVAEVAVAGVPDVQVRRSRRRLGRAQGRRAADGRRVEAVLSGSDRPFQDSPICHDRRKPAAEPSPARSASTC